MRLQTGLKSFRISRGFFEAKYKFATCIVFCRVKFYSYYPSNCPTLSIALKRVFSYAQLSKTILYAHACSTQYVSVNKPFVC